MRGGDRSRRDARRERHSRWEQPLEATAVAGLSAGLALATLLLVLVPQRLAQRPAQQGVIVLNVDAQGRLRLWNQPITGTALLPLLRRAAGDPARPRLRLRPDADVPWGRVQALAAELETLPLPLELQLP